MNAVCALDGLYSTAPVCIPYIHPKFVCGAVEYDTVGIMNGRQLSSYFKRFLHTN